MANGKIRFGKQSGGKLGLAFPDGVIDTEVVLPERGNIVSVDTAVTDNAIARYDGTTGKLQNSGVYIDDNGNVGVGVTLSAWSSGEKAIELPHYGYFVTKGPTCRVASNVYDNYAHKYTIYGTASMYEQAGGSHIWYSAPLGTAGSPITWTNAMTLDASGNLLLTSGTGALGYGAGAGGQVTQLTSKSTAVTLNKPSGTIYTHTENLAMGASVSFVVYNNLVTTADLVYVYGGAYSRYVQIVADNSTDENGKFSINITNNSGYNSPYNLPINFVIIKGARA